jgi:RNA polymerase sigma-70 factor (ECF subfamily)
MRTRIRDGEPEAFAELFEEHARAVYNYAFRLTGNWSTAEEVVSLTFLEAWRLRHKVRPDGDSLRPWLLGVATNTIRNLTRASRRYAAALSRIPPPRDVPDATEDVAARIDAAEKVNKTLALAKKLSRTELEVFMLCVWSGLNTVQAAQALGLPLGTVKSRLARAKKKLRELVGSKDPIFASRTVHE